jgi:hypothetical protein
MNRYLETLGLEPGVSEADIKRAYRKLAKMYHPDINQDPEAQQKFVEITEAYNFLLEVGATPHQENVSYNYDPFVQEYAERRRRAREYAREKKQQAAEEKWRMLSKLYKYSDYMVGIVLLTNLLFMLDYLLPANQQAERILRLVYSYESNNQYGQSLIYRHGIIEFEKHSILVDRSTTNEWQHIGPVAQVYATPIFDVVLKAEVILRNQPLALRPVFSIYQFFIFLIPAVILLSVLYYRWPDTSENKIGLIGILLILMIIQLLVFFTGR